MSLLQANRFARGWTLQDAVAEFLDVCRRADVGDAKLTVQQLSAFETGRSTPSTANLDRLCRTYETRPDRLGFGRDYTPGAEQETQAFASQASDAAALAPAGRSPEAPDAPRQREILRRLLAGVGVTLPASALDVLADARRSMADTLESATVGETGMEQLERTATEYGYAYQMVPPVRILAECVQDFLDVHALLQRRQPGEYRTRLCRVAAQLAGTGGMALVALGEHREARAWFRTGQIAAEETGDRALRAWLLAREAVIPFYFGAPQAALELAERARLLAGRTICATAAWAPSLEARSLARMGRGRDAEEAMKLAKDAFGRLPADSVSDTAYGYTERQLRWHEGSMYTTLGDTRRAHTALGVALDLYAPVEHLDRALIAFDQAMCLLHVREIATAARSTEQALLALPQEHLTGILVSRARDFLAQIPPQGARQPAVRDLRELVGTLGRPSRDEL